MTFVTGEQLRLLKAPEKARSQLYNLIEYLHTDGIASHYVFALYGLCCTGKTTLIIQTIKQLLEDDINPKDIGLFTGLKGDSFDELYRLLETRRDLRYIFIDEIGGFKGFLQKGSYLYDTLIRLYGCKIVVSGSMPALYTASKRTLYDRCRFIRISHLSFYEHCKFVLYKENPNKSDFMRYMKFGGLFHEPDDVSDYVRTNISETIIEMLDTQPKSETSAWLSPDSETIDWDERVHTVLSLSCNYTPDYCAQNNLPAILKREGSDAKIPNQVIMDFEKYFSLSPREREYIMKHTETVALLDFLVHCGIIAMMPNLYSNTEPYQCYVEAPFLQFHFTEEPRNTEDVHTLNHNYLSIAAVAATKNNRERHVKNYIIRELKQNEIPVLSDFLYEAIFQRYEDNLCPRDIINEPELKIFIEDFGKPDDLCLVAEVAGKIIGAVWTRILCGNVKGFGNIDEYTPEFAISIYKEFRGRGIGTELMRSMLHLLKNKDYKQASLAVQKDNYAVAMYKKVGFKIIGETEEEYIMVCKINTLK